MKLYTLKIKNTLKLPMRVVGFDKLNLNKSLNKQTKLD